MKIKLDPRTKIYMIFVVSAIVMMSATTPFLWGLRILTTMVPIALLIAEKRYASALRFFALYISALILSVDTDGEIVFGPENIGLNPNEIL